MCDLLLGLLFTLSSMELSLRQKLAHPSLTGSANILSLTCKGDQGVLFTQRSVRRWNEG